MSIFDNARSRETGIHGIDSIRPTMVECRIEETGARKNYTLDRNEEWVIELRLSQNFWANRVQRPHVERAAIEALAAMLYEDVLRELPRLRLCIQSGDKHGAMEVADRIERASKPCPTQELLSASKQCDAS